MFPLEGSGTHLDGPDPHPFPSSHLLLLITNTIYPLHNLPLPLSAHPCVDLGTPCWSLASTPPSPECPTGVEQDLGALTLPVFGVGHIDAAGWKRSVVKINALALWWSAQADLGISHSLPFFSWNPQKASPLEKNNIHQPFWGKGTLHFYSFWDKTWHNQYSFGGFYLTFYTLQCVTFWSSAQLKTIFVTSVRIQQVRYFLKIYLWFFFANMASSLQFF